VTMADISAKISLKQVKAALSNLVILSFNYSQFTG
jgi:hypothetical protein